MPNHRIYSKSNQVEKRVLVDDCHSEQSEESKILSHVSISRFFALLRMTIATWYVIPDFE